MTEKQEHLKNTIKKVLPRNVAFPLLVDALAAFFGVRREFIDHMKWALLHTDPQYQDLTAKLTHELIAVTSKKGKCLPHKRESARYNKLKAQLLKLEHSANLKAQTEVDVVLDNVLLNLECVRSMDRVIPVGENAMELLESLSSYRVE